MRSSFKSFSAIDPFSLVEKLYLLIRHLNISRLYLLYIVVWNRSFKGGLGTRKRFVISYAVGGGGYGRTDSRRWCDSFFGGVCCYSLFSVPIHFVQLAREDATFAI